jgi:MGT family glycosyltransferase
MAASAFQDLPAEIVLSIGEDVDPHLLKAIPSNCVINRSSPNFDILPHCRLFIGQGGPASILEAIEFGVPVLIIPPSKAHDICARRVVELGLGARLLNSSLSIASLRSIAEELLDDTDSLTRVRYFQRLVRKTNGAVTAATLIESHL